LAVPPIACFALPESPAARYRTLTAQESVPTDRAGGWLAIATRWWRGKVISQGVSVDGSSQEVRQGVPVRCGDRGASCPLC